MFRFGLLLCLCVAFTAEAAKKKAGPPKDEDAKCNSEVLANADPVKTGGANADDAQPEAAAVAETETTAKGDVPKADGEKDKPKKKGRKPKEKKEEIADSSSLMSRRSLNSLVKDLLENMDVGNGAYATREYSPDAFSLEEEEERLKADMQNFDEDYNLISRAGVGPVTEQIERVFRDMDYDEAQTTKAKLLEVLSELSSKGALQEVLYRGLDSDNPGEDYGTSFFSIPHQVFIYAVDSKGKGTRVEIFFEWGD